MATGVRIYNGEVGLNIHGDQLETIVDIAASKGKRTGIITTDWLAGATPMGFSSHNVSRNNSVDLVKEAAKSSNVNMFLSHEDRISTYLEDEGYVEIADPTKISDATEEKIYGSYYINAQAESMYVSKELVALDGLVLEALDYLAKDEDGFFLMAEGARIDKGGHNNSIKQMLYELMAFDAAVKVVVDWAMQRDDTIVIVTADHETGGLQLGENVNQKNLMIEGEGYLWESSGHSGVDVDCFIGGANIDFASYSFGQSDRIKNTDIFQIMKSFIVG
jgi:alkaline phosphatase